MDQLYGTEISIQVYNRLEEPDPLLNKEVQEIAYKHYWLLPGLSIRDKSLITVVSLISLKKEEQVKPHMNGFLNTGGTKEDLINMLLYLSLPLGSDSTQNGVNTLCEILKERSEEVHIISGMQSFFQESIKKLALENNSTLGAQ